MKITVNGEALATDAATLEELCRELGFADAKIATALNGAFVPKSERTGAALADGAAVEILSPRQGG
ncbi:sulfur carrier protein ThiS [Rhodomicrobium sp. Az07]|uniref:sulfur carrier protein ThiS n=1 Tax=Rhodomicrobium sp. Az07 TaxID=2839034 RepID=UPI001BE95302|nr:sulfur carrier protein ThiS [Rhodomicrobium sp. Az07]MBT3069859.1 sulfur carrier protein ThiS [Rhodomicrobium sp. Az07]